MSATREIRSLRVEPDDVHDPHAGKTYQFSLKNPQTVDEPFATNMLTSGDFIEESKYQEQRKALKSDVPALGPPPPPDN